MTRKHEEMLEFKQVIRESLALIRRGILNNS